MSAAELVARVERRGFEFRPGATGPVLHPVRTGAELPPELLQLLKEHRAAVIEHVATCERCGRLVETADALERVQDCLFCDRQECPHKRRARR